MSVQDEPVDGGDVELSVSDATTQRSSKASTSTQRDELTDEGPKSGKVAPDSLFDILQNERRRAVIRYLKQRDSKSVTIDDLATHIAARENNVDVSQVSSTQRKRVYIGLYQSHLPKMDDFDVIDYDQNRGTIRREDLSPLVPHLSLIDQKTRSHASTAGDAVIGFLVASGLLSTVGLAGLGPFGFVADWVWMTAIIVAFGLLAIFSYAQ